MNVFLSKKSKLIIIFSIIIILIFTTTSSIFKWYFDSVTPNINEIVVTKLEKVVYEILTSELNTKEINENNMLVLTKNKDGEIITVDYDLKKAYEINNNINNSIRKSINNLNNSTLRNSEFENINNSLFINIPLFINSKYSIISSLGPSIPIKIDFVDTIMTNLKTKVTSYGMNNSLAEIYVVTEVKIKIITPVTSKEIVINYDILIDATMINGRIPMFYGSDITSESNILDVPLK